METSDKSLLKVLASKGAGTFAIFDKGDFYTCYGEDAKLLATEVFKSEFCLRTISLTGILRTYLSIDVIFRRYPVANLNTARYQRVVQELLLFLRHRVELYELDEAGKWSLKAKDMFKTAKPAVSQVGMRMMMNMGWRPGRSLGRDGTGDVEPLTLDVKSDRKGLQTLEDLPARMSAAQYRNAQPTDVLVMELCSKRRWGNPLFTCHEYGMPNNREFLWSAVINGVTYQPAMSSRVKKDGKAVVCQVILQALGVLPRDPNLPVRI